jgi:FkbM family methyltransferase
MQQEINLPAQPVEGRNWISRLEAGEAGVSLGAAIKFRAGLFGCVARGSLGYLRPGRYRLALGIRSRSKKSTRDQAGILIELIACCRLISAHLLTKADLANTHHKFVFDLPEPATAIEVCISALSSVEATIHEVTVDPLGSPPEERPSQAIRLQNWLPLLDVGPAGRRPEFGAEAEQGVTAAVEGCSGYVVCGPGWPLPPSRYKLTTVVELPKGNRNANAIGRLEVAADTAVIASAEIRANRSIQNPLVLFFEVAQPRSNGLPALIEARVFSKGTVGFRLHALKVEQQGLPTARTAPWLGNFVLRTRAKLSGLWERTAARSMRPLLYELETALAQQAEEVEARQQQLAAALLAQLERLEAGADDRLKTIEALATRQGAAGETLAHKLERLEADSARRGQALEVSLGERLERLEADVARRGQALEVSLGERLEQLEANVARRGQALEVSLGERLERLEADVARRGQALEVSLGERLEQLEANVARRGQALEVSLGERLERLEADAARREQVTEILSTRQRADVEKIGRGFERLAARGSLQEQGIAAISGQLRVVSEGLGERLDRLETDLSRYQQVIQVAVDQQSSNTQVLQETIEQSDEDFSEVAQQVALLKGIVEKLPTFQMLKGLGIEDHLLQSYGSAPPLHPVGDWHVGTGINNPMALHKERVQKWNALEQPALLVWHADLKVMLWPNDESSRALFITGNFEPSEMSWFADNLTDDMVFIDVGANIGLYTMLGAKLVGSGGRVIAVEPSEREFQRISFHVVLNDLSNVTCLRLAAADRMGVAHLKVAGKEKSGQNTLGKFVTQATEALRVEKVRTYPLDRVVSEHKLTRVDVIKIDVEGAEMRVLHGLAGTLKSLRPKLLVDLTPDALAVQNTTSQAIIEFLRDQSYQLFEFSRTTGGLQKLRGASTGHDSKNIVAIPAR